jgi:pyruvate/2-oxoglutarate dehydrogenase complex dihydrolipoamide acyltransferase (E2) component
MALVMMPRLGVSVTEGTVSVWLKSVGDEVEVGEPICEVSTDKVDTEVESTATGVLREQRYAEGETVLVGEPLALVEVVGEAAPALDQTTTPKRPGPDSAADEAPVAPTAPVAPSSPAAGPAPRGPAVLRPGPFDHAAAVRRVLDGIASSGRPAASPAARRVAAEAGLDLAKLRRSGGAGHVTREDVASSLAAPAPSVGCPGVPPGYEDVPYDDVETSRIRRVTAEHMSRSRHTAAHMTTEVDVDLGVLSDVRAGVNSERGVSGQSKLSFLPFIARATCAALLEYPDLNATFEGERLLRWREVNLGIAVDTPKGLLVPVVRGAERLTLEPLAAAFVQVAEGARTGKLDADAYRAGTFTLSNPGSVGAVSAPAIINQPQVAILGMPAIVRLPWVVLLEDGQEAIAIRPILRLALTFDHRAVDGADATRALAAVRRRLESWGSDDYR